MSTMTTELNGLVNRLEKEMDYSQDPWRCTYHVMPPVGWLNDPNGLCQIGTTYHAFFQYSPQQVEGGLKYWGHAVSEDMIHWSYLPVALYPDQVFDCHGVYSGSALVENNEAWLYYTGNVKLNGEQYNYITDGRQSNTILTVMKADGSFSEKQCLLTNEDYPDSLTCHVRDPKVWQENGIYYMVLGARTKEDVGCVLVYSSQDKIHWQYVHTLTSKEPKGYMWECPDLFTLNGQRILSISPQGLEADGWFYRNIYQSGYSVVKGDFAKDGIVEGFTELDRGFDFYAPQTFTDKQGRRILIGWLGMPDCPYKNPTVQYNWQHMLTIPRVLEFKNGQIYQTPVEEYKSMRKNMKPMVCSKGEVMQLHSSSEMAINNQGKDFEILIDQGMALRYEKGVCQIEFIDDQIGYGRDARGIEMETPETIQLLFDASSLEIFINHGQVVFSTRIYPKEKGHTFKLVSGQLDLCTWTLEL